MEIFWLCEQCDSTNNYEETSVCSVCGEKIDSKSEEKCIYEVAEQMSANAVTSRDFLAACEQYLRVLHYKDARQKHSECQFKAEKTLLNETIYAKAKQHFQRAEDDASSEQWDDAIREFTAAEQQFNKIRHFSDADQWADTCRREAQLCESKRVYFDAKALLASATTIADYKKAADMFLKIDKFADAKENHTICLTFIEQLTAKQQLEELRKEQHLAAQETDLDKKIAILQHIVNVLPAVLSEDAKAIVLQSKPILEDCLQQKRAIQTKQDLDAATEKYNEAVKIEAHASRLQRLERIVGEYTAYAQTAAFAPLFAQCHARITETKNDIAYQEAVDTMHRAVTYTDFKGAAEAFARLGNFRDSEAKQSACNEKADLLAKESTYQSALEAFEKGRKISLFNWKKYR